MSKGKRHTPRPYPGRQSQLCAVCGAWRDYNRNSYGPWVRGGYEGDPAGGLTLPACPGRKPPETGPERA